MTASPCLGDKVIERPVFFLANGEVAFRFGIVVLSRLPQRRFVYFRDSHWTSLPPDSPFSLVTRSVAWLPHFGIGENRLTRNRVLDCIDLQGLKTSQIGQCTNVGNRQSTFC